MTPSSQAFTYISQSTHTLRLPEQVQCFTTFQSIISEFFVQFMIPCTKSNAPGSIRQLRQIVCGPHPSIMLETNLTTQYTHTDRVLVRGSIGNTSRSLARFSAVSSHQRIISGSVKPGFTSSIHSYTRGRGACSPESSLSLTTELQVAPFEN